MAKAGPGKSFRISEMRFCTRRAAVGAVSTSTFGSLNTCASMIHGSISTVKIL